jgi:hypothetical protein
MMKYWMALLAMTGAVCFGQTAQISGEVRDTSGAGIGDATVTIANAQVGFSREVETDGHGRYALPLLPPGAYALKAEKTGFRILERTVLLRVDETAVVNLTLEPGEGSQRMQAPAKTVFGAAPTGAIKTVVDAQRTQETPLNGRDVLQLVALTPGAVKVTGSVQGNRGSLSHGSSVSVNGGRDSHTNYYVDGAEGTDFSVKGPSATPHPDAVQEMSVQSNSYSAAYGGGAGAVVNLVTRGGTNTLRGSLFEFFRNDVLDARNASALDKQSLRYNQFGFTLGGPVYLPKLFDGRDRTFFFVSYQGTRIHQGTPQSTVVPSLAERAGNFSALTAPLRDPDTKAPFPNKLLPASQLSPAALAFQNNLLPAANSGDKLFVFNQDRPQHSDFYQMRIDHALGSANRLSGRYTYQDSVQSNPTNLPITVRAKASGDHSFSLNDTHNLSASASNNFSASLLRVDFATMPAQVFTWNQIGVRVPRAAEEAVPAADLRVNSYFGRVWGGAQQDEPRSSLRVSDTFTWSRGRHQMRFGGSLQRQTYTVSEDELTDGAFAFQGRFSGDNYADFLLGRPSLFEQQTEKNNRFRRTSASFFVQDDIRVSRTLALNLGLRWEPYLPFREADDRMGGYVPGLVSSRFTEAPAGMVFSGDAGVPKGFLRTRWQMLSPRLGFAWTPSEESRTVLRGGYGIFYDQPRPIVLTELISPFQPWALNIKLNDVRSFDDPYAGRTAPFPYTAPSGTAASFALPLEAGAVDPGFRNGYVQQWNFSLQRQVVRRLVASVSYVASKGTALWVHSQENFAQYSPAATLQNIQERRPLACFRAIPSVLSAGNSSYQALQATLNRRFTGGLSVLAHYTFGKSIDNVSEENAGNIETPNPKNAGLNRARSDFDVRHRFVTSVIYELPFFRAQKGLFGKLAGGWQVSSVVTAQSGHPFSVLSGVPNSFSGTSGDRADLTGNPFTPAAGSWFNTAAFVVNAPGTWGNSGRNILTAPGLFDTDLSLSRTVAINERMKVQLRGEFFNLFNHTNPGQPNNTVSSPLFGAITTSAPARVAQIGLKVSF